MFSARSYKPLKRYSPPPVYVQQRIIWHSDGPELILPLIIHAQHGYAKAKETEDRATKQHMLCVLSQLNGWCRALPKDRIEHIAFTRIGMGRLAAHDNLPWAFKSIVDITSYWILDGAPLAQKDARWKRIGDYDDILIERGRPTWSYSQRTNGEGEHRQRKKPQGISIRFQMSPHTSFSTYPIDV